jgi:hypothetical protein
MGGNSEIIIDHRKREICKNIQHIPNYTPLAAYIHPFVLKMKPLAFCFL